MMSCFAIVAGYALLVWSFGWYGAFAAMAHIGVLIAVRWIDRIL